MRFKDSISAAWIGYPVIPLLARACLSGSPLINNSGPSLRGALGNCVESGPFIAVFSVLQEGFGGSSYFSHGEKKMRAGIWIHVSVLFPNHPAGQKWRKPHTHVSNSVVPSS